MTPTGSIGRGTLEWYPIGRIVSRFRLGEAMETTQSQKGQVTLLTLVGELDRREVATFESLTDSLMESNEPFVLLDMAALESIDGAGVRALFGLSRKLASRDGKVVLCSPRPEVLEALRITGLAFEIRPDRESALRLLPTGSRLSRIARLTARLLALGSSDAMPRRATPSDTSTAELRVVTAKARELLAGKRPAPVEPSAEPEAETELPEAGGQGWTRFKESLASWISRGRSS